MTQSSKNLCMYGAQDVMITKKCAVVTKGSALISFEKRRNILPPFCKVSMAGKHAKNYKSVYQVKGRTRNI